MPANIFSRAWPAPTSGRIMVVFNANRNNYIKEKIFDSFFSGCVPIYWGADNVQEYIPPNCFIDRRRFRDTAEVHRYLMGITPEEYGQFQRNISDFLRSEKAYL